MYLPVYLKIYPSVYKSISIVHIYKKSASTLLSNTNIYLLDFISFRKYFHANFTHCFHRLFQRWFFMPITVNRGRKWSNRQVVKFQPQHEIENCVPYHAICQKCTLPCDLHSNNRMIKI